MKAEVIALGENHHGTHTKAIRKFLATSQQFNGVFEEWAQDYQLSADYYLKTGKLDQDLGGFFDRATIRSNPIRESSILLLDYARENNLPLICVDSSLVKTEKYSHQSPINHFFIAGESRDEDMFNSVREHLKDGERWLLLGGIEHLRPGLHFRSGYKTLGERLYEWLGNGFELVVLK